MITEGISAAIEILGLATLGSSYSRGTNMGQFGAHGPDDPRWRFSLDSKFAAWVLTPHIQPELADSASFPIMTFSFLPGPNLYGYGIALPKTREITGRP